MERDKARKILMVSAMLFAEGAYAQQTPDARGLPLAVAAQMNLGQAGLLEQYYSDSHYASSKQVIGQSRSTYGAAEVPGAPGTGYEDGTSAGVFSLNVQKALPDQSSYLRFRIGYAIDDGAPELVDLDTKASNIEISYLRFPTLDTMYSFGLIYEKLNQDIGTTGTNDRHSF